MRAKSLLLATGLALACHKRPVSSEALEQVVDEIERRLYDRGDREVPAAVIGERVIEALRALDPVAYVRFASVYREFQDATQFKEIVEVLREEQPQTDDPLGERRPPAESTPSGST